MMACAWQCGLVVDGEVDCLSLGKSSASSHRLGIRLQLARRQRTELAALVPELVPLRVAAAVRAILLWLVAEHLQAQVEMGLRCVGGKRSLIHPRSLLPIHQFGPWRPPLRRQALRLDRSQHFISLPVEPVGLLLDIVDDNLELLQPLPHELFEILRFEALLGWWLLRLVLRARGHGRLASRGTIHCREWRVRVLVRSSRCSRPLSLASSRVLHPLQEFALRWNRYFLHFLSQR